MQRRGSEDVLLQSHLKYVIFAIWNLLKDLNFSLSSLFYGLHFSKDMCTKVFSSSIFPAAQTKNKIKQKSRQPYGGGSWSRQLHVRRGRRDDTRSTCGGVEVVL